MPFYLIDPEEALEEQCGDSSFYFKRLSHDDQKKITYLSVRQGALDQELYEKVCVAVSLQGWKEVYGKKPDGTPGMIAWPLRLSEEIETPLTPENRQALVTLFPKLTLEDREALTGAMYVVRRMHLEIVTRIFQRIHEYAPEALKKSYVGPLNGNSSFSTDAPSTNIPVLTVEGSMPRTAASLPATAAGLAPVPTGKSSTRRRGNRSRGGSNKP
jgi:hypothetical protein